MTISTYSASPVPRQFFRPTLFGVFLLLSPSVVFATAAADPFSLNVPWAGDFSGLSANEINVKTDSRLTTFAKGDGASDDTDALQSAINLAGTTGGGVVYLPSGDYKVVTRSDPQTGTPLKIPSHVVLRGDTAKTSRLFVYNDTANLENDWIGGWGGISFQDASLTGMINLGVYNVNPSAASCAVLWNRGTTAVHDVVLSGVDVHLGNGRNIWFENTDKVLVQNSTIDSASWDHGPLFIVYDTQVLFQNNAVTYHSGRVQMQFNDGAVISSNTFVRDAMNRSMDQGTTIESGGIELTFGAHIQLLNNYFQTLNVSLQETGDGEAIMTQHSNIPDMQDVGSVTAAGATTLTDSSALWGPVLTSHLNDVPKTIVAIISGRAAGTWRTITAVDAVHKTVTVDQPWDPVPEVGSRFSITRWTISDLTVRNNTLVDNPHGIALGDGALNTTVDGNVLYDSNNIALRIADQPFDGNTESRRMHGLAFHNKITNNVLWNTKALRPSFLILDVEAFFPADYHGLGIYDTQVTGNRINPDLSSPSQVYPTGQMPGQEGYYPCYMFGPAAVQDPVSVAIQKLYYSDNSIGQPISYASRNSTYATQSCVTASVAALPQTPQTEITPHADAPRVYPNPWRSTHGNTPITFDGMPANSTVKIFTVSGHLIKTLSAPAGSVQWNHTSTSNAEVASGLYLYSVTDGRGSQSEGKLALIR